MVTIFHFFLHIEQFDNYTYRYEKLIVLIIFTVVIILMSVETIKLSRIRKKT